MTTLQTLGRSIASRDPETLVGPLLQLLTRRAASGESSLDAVLAEHFVALSAHPAVDPTLRIAAGALAIEHRPKP